MEPIQFADLGISALLLKAVDNMGFEAPTKIQAVAIPPLLAKKDVAGQAQTGTGKTAAFAIPILEHINPDSGQVQALILCPTRELAVQVTGEIIKLAQYIDGLHVTPVYGGQPIQRQLKQLKKGTQIVVGTPGRVIDHLKRGTLDLSDLQMVVLDEADEMLNMGFRDDIEKILGFSNGKAQTVMFSATMSGGIKKIMQRWLKNPEMIRVEGQATAADGIEHYIVEVRDSMRTEAICRILDINDYRLALVFCNTKRKCDSLVGDMQARGFSSDVLHGDLSQNIRDKVMNKFRRGRIDVLIATDVAARGLDVEDVDVVFNYDIPQDPEYYVHRVGRTGRAGRTGVAYTFSTGRRNKNLKFIEKQLSSGIKTLPLPSLEEVEASKMNSYLEDVINTLQAGGLRPYIEQVESILTGSYTPIEVAAAMLKMQNGTKAESSSGSAAGAGAGVGKKERGWSGKGQAKKRDSRKQKRGKKQEPFYSHFANKEKGKGKAKNRIRKSGKRG